MIETIACRPSLARLVKSPSGELTRPGSNLDVHALSLREAGGSCELLSLKKTKKNQKNNFPMNSSIRYQVRLELNIMERQLQERQNGRIRSLISWDEAACKHWGPPILTFFCKISFRTVP